MCFHIHPKHEDPKVAKKNIKCYKILVKEEEYILKSPIYDFYYILNELYATELKFDRFMLSITEGFHSVESVKMANLMRYNYVIVECTIPKGSIYYYNPTHLEYVSNKIIIDKIL